MNISLISEDSELHSLCGEVLKDFPGLEWRLTPSVPSGCPAGADLYIWDDHGRITAPPDFDQTWLRHLFIVDGDDISRYRHRPDEISAAAILLKPVKRECLSAFLALAATAHERNLRTSSLRADRDEILQCLIQSSVQIQKHDQDRANFLARAVHDFRGPLMSANGYCGLLLSEAVGPENEEQKE